MKECTRYVWIRAASHSTNRGTVGERSRVCEIASVPAEMVAWRKMRATIFLVRLCAAHLVESFFA